MLAIAIATACEDPPRVGVSADASAPLPPAPFPRAREGCARAGPFDAIESDPSCIVKEANEDAMRAVAKQLTITLEAEPPEVMSGGTSLLSLTVKNTSSIEAMLLLEARPRASGTRTDWSRVAGVPEPRSPVADAPHLFFPPLTTDASGRDVDSLPTIAVFGGAPAPPPTFFAVRLRPGGKLTRAVSWWALRIPAPPPVVKDDAGHRFSPKTTALNLAPGEYTVTMELPFLGMTREERKIGTRVRVARATLPDGGLRPLE